MAEIKVTKPAQGLTQTQAWESPKETWQYVNIPDEDPLGKKFATISMNSHKFEAGRTYQLPAPVAVYVLDRIKQYNKACVRVLQPNVDLKSLNEVAVGSQTPQAGTVVDGNTIQTL